MLDKYAQRINSMSDSIFTTMSEWAREYNAINLGQGFPNLPCQQFLKDAACKAILDDKNQYAPPPGIFSLRTLISETNLKNHGIEYDPISEITITAGATEGLFSTIHAFIEQDDEVIMFEPFYDGHEADVLLAGGIPRYVTLHTPDFHFDENEFIEQISEKTKMIIINTPNNPTGKVYTQKELEFIATIAKKHDLLVLADEVYEFLTFEGVKHISIATLPDMRERTITISSTGKTFGVTGWKVGYICAPEELTDAIRKIHQWTTFTINTPGQHAVAEGFRQMDTYLPSYRNTYQQKRDLALKMLKDSPFKPLPSNGTFYMMIALPEGKYLHDVDAAEQLIKNQGVATIPTSCFYKRSDEGRSLLRICFAKDDKTLIEGLTRLRDIVF